MLLEDVPGSVSFGEGKLTAQVLSAFWTSCELEDFDVVMQDSTAMLY